MEIQCLHAWEKSIICHFENVHSASWGFYLILLSAFSSLFSSFSPVLIQRKNKWFKCPFAWLSKNPFCFFYIYIYCQRSFPLVSPKYLFQKLNGVFFTLKAFKWSCYDWTLLSPLLQGMSGVQWCLVKREVIQGKQCDYGKRIKWQ